MNLSGNQRLTIIAGILCAATLASAWAQSPTSADKDQLISDFETRAKQYVDFRQKVAGKLPRPSNDPQKIVARRKELAEKIRVARAGAPQGQLFTPAIAEYFRHQIAASLAGQHGKEIQESLRHAEPVHMELQINESYPANVPLQSTPPTLLLNLPPLPEALEYRVVDRELVLRDREANIIVDYVPNAMPAGEQ